MAYIFYYLIIKPISFLPARVHYLISDFLFLIFYYFGVYRKKIVRKQISDSFPEKSKEEVEKIVVGFFRHFCDLLVESAMIFSMPLEEAIRRCKVRENDFLNRLFKEGRNILVVGGHYNNWEMLAIAVDAQTPHQVTALYAPLFNKTFDKLMKESRTKFGLVLFPKQIPKALFEANWEKPFAAIFGADQCPRSKKVYWTTFLNQETAVAFGTEKYAKEYNCPVVFGRIIKKKRGMYEIDFELISEDPGNEPHGAITQKHVRMLERDIREKPEYWLWTHKRWKRKRKPEEVLHPVATPTGDEVASPFSTKS